MIILIRETVLQRVDCRDKNSRMKKNTLSYSNIKITIFY